MHRQSSISSIICFTGSLGKTILLFCTISMLYACSESESPTITATPRVKFYEVGQQSIGQVRKISGKVVAADTSPLAFAVGGTVDSVAVNLGDSVTAGQLLARLDTEPMQLALEQARAQLNIARAKVQETELIYKRTLDLQAKRASSQAEVDAATANLQSAKGTLRGAQSDVESRERDLKLAELRAPFDGRIAARTVVAFQEIQPGEQAVLLQSADALEVEVRIPETMIRDIDFGQLVRIEFPTLPDVSVSGTIAEIGSRVESGNSYPVTLQPGKHSADLRAGMTASVIFNFQTYEQDQTVYLLPLSALALEQGLVAQGMANQEADSQDPAAQSVPVFVINDDMQLEARSIVAGNVRGNQLEVFSGLNAGDKVVTAGVSFLREGMTVALWNEKQGLSDG